MVDFANAGRSTAAPARCAATLDRFWLARLTVQAQHTRPRPRLPVGQAGLTMGLTRRPNGGSLDALSGGSLVAEPPAAALSGVAASRPVVLLATKLHVPGPLPGFVPRPRLVEALARLLCSTI